MNKCQNKNKEMIKVKVNSSNKIQEVVVRHDRRFFERTWQVKIQNETKNIVEIQGNIQYQPKLNMR